MNIAANQAIYPQTASHLPYANGAILQSPLQQTASLVGGDEKSIGVFFLLVSF